MAKTILRITALFLAVVMCHEIDHLSGILYKDKATVYERIPATEEGE